MSLLLEAGADPNFHCRVKGWHRCILLPFLVNLEAVSLLLDHQAEVNARDFDGNTALYLAVSKKWTTVVSKLMSAGADVHAATNASAGGATALHFAAQYGYLELAVTLIDAKADISTNIAFVNVRDALAEPAAFGSW